MTEATDRYLLKAARRALLTEFGRPEKVAIRLHRKGAIMTDDTLSLSFLTALDHGGWLVAALTASWGFILRAIIGRTLRSLERVEQRLSGIDKELAEIKGRFQERDTRADSQRTYMGPERRR